MDEALSRFPKEYSTLITAGYVYQNKPDLDKAISLFERARALRPDKAEVHACLADAYGHKHKFENALEEANKALSLNNKLDLAYYEKGAALICLKRYKDAVEPLKRNFDTDPLEAKSSQLYLEDLLQLKRPSDAFEVLLCRLSAMDTKQLDSFKDGVRSFIPIFPASVSDEAIKRAHNDLIKTPLYAANMHFAVGDVYDSLKKPEKAVEQYREGLKLNPKAARGYLRLGFDLDSQFHDVIGGMDNYKKAYKLRPEDPQIKLAYETTEKRINDSLWLRFLNWVHNLFTPQAA